MEPKLGFQLYPAHSTKEKDRVIFPQAARHGFSKKYYLLYCEIVRKKENCSDLKRFLIPKKINAKDNNMDNNYLWKLF